MSVRTWLAAKLLGHSAYAPMVIDGPSLDDPAIERARAVNGGRLSPIAITQMRWYPGDIELIRRAADGGDISPLVQLCKASSTDSVLAGLKATRTGGLVSLPKRFHGRADIVRALEGRGGVRPVFDEMFPPAELALLAENGIDYGIGVAELVPVPGRDYPVMVTLDPEFLRFRMSENRWYYHSSVGPIPITPGDGRWILHVPGGRLTPWAGAIGFASGNSWINKLHAANHLANWEGKLANPARVAECPQAATETQRLAFMDQLMGWGVNTVFSMPAGWQVRLLESNGRGWESFIKTIERSEREYAIAYAGQVVTVDGGTGFNNQDLHKSIRADLIKRDADGLGFTINTQGLPFFVLTRFGEEALDESACVEWDVREPRNLAAEAATMSQVAGAITALRTALEPYKRDVDVKALVSTFGIPIAGDSNGDGEPELELEAEYTVEFEEDDEADDAEPIELDDSDIEPEPAQQQAMH